MDIDIIIKKLENKYFNSLNITLIKNNIDIEWIKTHIINLNNIEDVNNLEIKNNVIIKTDQTETNLYKKSWSKLNVIHKIIKIKEFVNNLNIDIEKNREELKNLLVELVKTKILSKKNNIEYDEINGKIISIKNLQYKDNKYYYFNE